MKILKSELLEKEEENQVLRKNLKDARDKIEKWELYLSEKIQNISRESEIRLLERGEENEILRQDLEDVRARNQRLELSLNELQIQIKSVQKS